MSDTIKLSKDPFIPEKGERGLRAEAELNQKINDLLARKYGVKDYLFGREWQTWVNHASLILMAVMTVGTYTFLPMIPQFMRLPYAVILLLNVANQYRVFKRVKREHDVELAEHLANFACKLAIQQNENQRPGTYLPLDNIGTIAVGFLFDRHNMDGDLLQFTDSFLKQTDKANKQRVVQRDAKLWAESAKITLRNYIVGQIHEEKLPIENLDDMNVRDIMLVLARHDDKANSAAAARKLYAQMAWNQR